MLVLVFPVIVIAFELNDQNKKRSLYARYQALSALPGNVFLVALPPIKRYRSFIDVAPLLG